MLTGQEEGRPNGLDHRVARSPRPSCRPPPGVKTTNGSNTPMTNPASHHGPSRATTGRWLRWLTALGLCLGLAACSGGSGSDDDGTTPTPTQGLLRVTVKDAFGAAVAGATVVAQQGLASVNGTTSADGVAILSINWPSGSAGVNV